MREGWRARALIDQDALKDNIRTIKGFAKGAKIMAVIKADAYGHGLQVISRSIEDQVEGFAVATLSEGVLCRESQKSKPITVLSEWWSDSQLNEFTTHQLQPVIHNDQQLNWLEAYRGEALSVWLKIESGMNRLGVPSQVASTVYRKLKRLDTVKEVRLISHLANADDMTDRFTDQQADLFRQGSHGMKEEKSLANSAGLILWPQTRLDWVRPGLMLYGASPVKNKTPDALNLHPVMHLQARLISIKQASIGQPVGYGGQTVLQRDSVIGIVGLGYGDGYPRVVSDAACVLVKGHRAGFLGRVSMDMITIDLTDIPDVQIGDVVTLWGPGLTVDEVAEWAGTIPYELLCKVTPRIPRVLVR